MSMKEKNDYIYGVHTIQEALDQGRSIEKVFFKTGLKGRSVYELRKRLEEQEIPFQIVPLQKIEKITRKNHQGVLAFIAPVQYQKVEDIIQGIFEHGENPFILVLDRITDVRNFGAIARTALASGVHAIVIPVKGSAGVNADAIKTSSGALNKIPVCRAHSLSETLAFLKKSGIHVVAASGNAEKYYFKKSLIEPLALILGSEEKGISQKNFSLADDFIKIPVNESIDSLNVSAATAVLCYEVVKQRIGSHEN